MAEEIEVAYVAIDLGTTRRKSLSDGTIATLQDVAEHINERGIEGTVLLHCNANLRNCLPLEQSDAEKAQILQDALIVSIRRISFPARNSIEEAKGARQALAARDIDPDKVRRFVLCCDHWHGLRLRPIWELVFPNAKIELCTDGYVYGNDWGQMLLRFPFWVPMNLAYLTWLRIFGLWGLAYLKQP